MGVPSTERSYLWYYSNVRSRPPKLNLACVEDGVFAFRLPQKLLGARFHFLVYLNFRPPRKHELEMVVQTLGYPVMANVIKEECRI